MNVNVDRSLAGLVGLSEKDAATAMQITLAGSSQTSPTYWLNPKTGVSYPVSIQTPPRILSFARERLAAGADAVSAAIEAGSTRFRPVLMTALAMIIGMVPMAIEPSQNAPLGRP